MKKEVQDSEKRKSSKKSVIVTACVAVSAIALGMGITFMLNAHLLQDQTIYAGDFETLEDDNAALMRKYASSNGDYSSFEPYELINISLTNFDASENHYSQVKGNVLAMGVEQTIYGTSIRRGDDYFNESLSTSSMVKVAKRFYQEGEKVDTYTGDIVDSRKAIWPSSISETHTLEEYEEKWGRDLSRGSIYIISEKTVLEQSQSLDEEGNYLITVSLDPDLSTVRYVRQMVSMSGLSRDPIFHSVTLEFTLDQDLKPISSTFTENYEVYMVVTANSDGKQYTLYHQDEAYPIPDGTQDLDYGAFDQ